jgi:hypothetical protein
MKSWTVLSHLRQVSKEDFLNFKGRLFKKEYTVKSILWLLKVQKQDHDYVSKFFLLILYTIMSYIWRYVCNKKYEGKRSWFYLARLYRLINVLEKGGLRAR